MEIELVIDNREIELIKKLQIDHKITIEQLEVGDVVFRQGDETIFVIERKSVNDLKSSICDGRAREQKTRLLGNFQRDRIMYLIQGSLDLPRNSEIRGLPVGTLIASLINTQLRDGIKVYKTSSMDETVEFLKKMHDKFQKNGDTFFKDQECISATAYSSSLKKKKKANMTTEVFFITQLCLIPQITSKIATEIVKKYSSINMLIAAYDITPEKLRNQLLSEINYNLQNNKTRRLGDKISTRVYHYFYGISSIV